MKKVALVNPPAAKIIYGEEYQLKSVTPCLGLFYLQSYCQDIADIEVFEGEFYTDMAHLIHEINNFRPDILGVTSNTSTYPLCVQLAREVDAKIKVVGGPYSNFRVEECLKEFDIVFLDDAEISFRTFLSGIPRHKVPGIAFYDLNGKLKYTPPAPVDDLDSVPFPEHKHLQLGLYQSSPHRKLPEPMATMVTTRGCGFSCTFCLSAVGGLNDGKYRERSVGNVISEIRILKDHFGVKSIQFWDDTFTNRKVRIKELCSALKEMDINYVCNTRTDKLDIEIANLLADSGCKGIFLGIESGDEEINNHDIGKETNNDQVRSAFINCHKAGMWSTASFIFGSINDTRESIENSIKFAIELNSDYVLFNIYTAHPGTKGYRKAIEQELIDEYIVDLDNLKREPVGIPTVCKNLSREELQMLKAEAYVRFYSQKDSIFYNDIIQTYLKELEMLKYK